MRRIEICIFVFIAFLPTVFPQEEIADLDKHFKAVHKLMERGKWKKARAALDLAFQQTHLRGEMQLRRQEILADVERCAFHISSPDPKPANVVDGKLHSYSPKTGKIKLSYTPGSRDFARDNGLKSHPASFAGPYTLEFKGKKYPRLTGSRDYVGPIAYASWGRDEGFSVIFGMAQVGVGSHTQWVPGRLSRYRDGDWNEVDAKEIAPVRPDKRYSLKIKVGRGDVKVSYNGKTYLSSKKSKKSFGSFAFRDFSFDELIVTGKIEPSWIQGKIDTLREDNRREFRAGFNVKQAVPAWVFENPAPRPSEGRKKPGSRDAEDEFEKFVAAHDAESAKKAGLALIEKELASFDTFRWMIYRLLGEGEIDQAAGLARAARSRGLGGREADSIQLMLFKARKGPDWSRSFEHASRHYRVFSDIDRETCVKATKVLEQAFLAYQAYLGRPAKGAQRRFKVYLFSGEKGYLAYCNGILGSVPSHTAGLYSPLLKQLLIWNLPNRESMMETVRHEGLHQFLDRLIGDTPTWLNEGLAEYYEAAGDGKWTQGIIRRAHLDVLSRSTLIPLRKFIRESHQPFYRDASRHYAQAWALVHFLRHSGFENSQLFKRLLAELIASRSAAQSIEKVLGQTDLAKLETEFKAWLLEHDV